jgi:uncharacterized protein YceH (UPF0502 family)
MFGSLDEVGHVLERLGALDEPLVRILPRQAGQKDQRWVHLLGTEPDHIEATATRDAPPAPESSDTHADLGRRVDRLEAVVAALCDELGIDADLLDAGDDR